MESMGKHDGHYSKFATLLRKPDRKFVSRVARLQLDEAQNIYTAGIPKHNQPAFRPAYGNFDALRLLFPKTTTVTAFSATFPRHILDVIKKKLILSPTHFFIRCTSNRPNIMYATHQIVGALSDFRNLSFLLPSNFAFHPPMEIPPTVIFHDNIKECSNAATFVDNLLPMGLRGLGLVKHYHGLMSQDYLERTYQDFQAGHCRILHTCPGMESASSVTRKLRNHR
jgi:superfamily II DNA helicase RecQ